MKMINLKWNKKSMNKMPISIGIRMNNLMMFLSLNNINNYIHNLIRKYKN